MMPRPQALRAALRRVPIVVVIQAVRSYRRYNQALPGGRRHSKQRFGHFPGEPL